MPNTFGRSAGTSTSVSYPIYDPRFERDARDRLRRDFIPQLQFANSLYVPSDMYPARGWILLKRSDYLNINTYATDLELEIDDLINPALTFGNLTVVQARNVSTGRATDPDSIYLVEITDTRGVLWNQWFKQPITDYYNIRAPAYPEQFYLNSTNGGTAWTWNLMVKDIWDQFNPSLGAYPGLPITPAGTPEGFAFPGTPIWEALSKILDEIGCGVAVNLLDPNPYTISEDGGTDAVMSALMTKYAPVKEDDFEWIDTGSGRVPGNVIVNFHRRNQFYGTEETIRMDSLQWETSSTYTVTVAAPAQFTNAQGTAILWDDFSVRFDENNSPLAADVATAAAIAAERSSQFYKRIYRGTLGYLRQIFTGALPFYTGSIVDGVCWKMDAPPSYNNRCGWRTAVIRTSECPWPEVIRGHY